MPTLDRRRFLQTGALGALGLAVGMFKSDAQQEKPLPARRPADAIDGPPIVSVRAWAILDGRNGRRLFGGNDAAALPMASTTKVMTAYIVLRAAADHARVLDEAV